MAYCDWSMVSEAMIRYHDEEWGVPLHDDRKQFEFLMMEVMQCGLNWNMMINKRQIFRECFAGFDFDQVAAFGEADIQRIMKMPGMIRSRRKIEAVIGNARCYQQIREEHGSFSQYIWSYTDGKTIIYNHHSEGWIPAGNGLSDQISKDLKRYGFKYLGSITVYSHFQACGIINDHAQECPRFQVINENYPVVIKRRSQEQGVRCFGDSSDVARRLHFTWNYVTL